MIPPVWVIAGGLICTLSEWNLFQRILSFFVISDPGLWAFLCALPHLIRELFSEPPYKNDFGLETKARFPRKLSIFSQSRLISFKVGTEWKKGIFAEDIPKFLELVKRYRFMIREFAVYRYDLQHLSGTFVLSWKSETPQKDIADSMDKDYDYLRHSVESLADGNPHQIIVTVILKTSSYDSEP